MVMSANIRLDWKILQGKNALAYSVRVTLTEKRVFVRFAPGVPPGLPATPCFHAGVDEYDGFLAGCLKLWLILKITGTSWLLWYLPLLPRTNCEGRWKPTNPTSIFNICINAVSVVPPGGKTDVRRAIMDVRWVGFHPLPIVITVLKTKCEFKNSDVAYTESLCLRAAPWYVALTRLWGIGEKQGILKGEVSLYCLPPFWLVWISLFCK
jgi:hypothetical protein